MGWTWWQLMREIWPDRDRFRSKAVTAGCPLWVESGHSAQANRPSRPGVRNRPETVTQGAPLPLRLAWATASRN